MLNKVLVLNFNEKLKFIFVSKFNILVLKFKK